MSIVRVTEIGPDTLSTYIPAERKLGPFIQKLIDRGIPWESIKLTTSRQSPTEYTVVWLEPDNSPYR